MLFLNIVFAFIGPLHCHMNFRMSLSISVEKDSWDFYKDCVESIDRFESITILTLLILSINEMFLHLFRSPLVSFGIIL